MSINFYEESPMKKIRLNVLQPLGNSMSRMGVKKRKTSRLSFLLGLLAVIAITGIFAGALADKTFPVAEGWYTQYADMINHGSVPYRDFEYLFFPLYMYIIAGITSVFGYSIMVLRVVGVLVFIGIGVAAYLIFNECFDTIPAAAAGSVTAMFIQSEVVQIFYDYIRFMDLFIYIAIFFLVRAMRDYTIGKKRLPVNALLAGVFSAAACLVKQSAGMLFICYCIVLFLFMAIVGSKPKRALGYGAAYVVACGAVIGAVMGCLAAVGALEPFFNLALGGAVSAKGGLATVLFAWIGNLFLSASSFMPTVTVLAIFIVANMWLTYEYPMRKSAMQQNYVLAVFAAVSVAGLVLCLNAKPVAAYFYTKVIGNTPSIIYALTALLFLAMGVYYLLARFSLQHSNRTFIAATLPFFALLGSVFAIGYGSGTSGGLCESQTALAIGVILAVALQFSQHRYEKIVQTVILAFACSIVFVTCSRKIVVPYSWWGQSVEDIWSETETTNIPLLEGIKVSSTEKQMLEGVYNAVQSYSEPGDTMYAFPQIPIFYKMCDRTSISYTQVQWFDVSTEKGIYEDMRRLCTAPPKIIVTCNVPESVTAAHENAFNNALPSQERIMADFLSAFTAKNGYLLVGSYAMATDYSLSVYVSPENVSVENKYEDYWNDLPQNSKYQIIAYLSEFCDDYENMDFYLKNAEPFYAAFDKKVPSNMKKMTLSSVEKAFNENVAGFMMEKDIYKNILSDDAYSSLREKIAGQFTLCRVKDGAVVLVKKDKAKNIPQYTTATVEYSYSSGFYLDEEVSKKTDFVWTDKNAQLELTSFKPTDQQIILHMHIYAPTQKEGSLIVRCGDQVYEVYVNSDPQQRTVVDVPITLQPGVNRIMLYTTLEKLIDTEDTRNLYYQLADLSIETPGLYVADTTAIDQSTKATSADTAGTVEKKEAP